ncbi:MAG: hypothetical protein ABW321_01845 [Polyangiales bacterium]
MIGTHASRLAAASFIVAGCLLGASRAHADLSACGEIDLPLRAECTWVEPSIECEARCTPVAVRATCETRLARRCSSRCRELPTATCHGECEAACRGDCRVDPGALDCRDDCRVDCDGRCAARCDSRGDRRTCLASCSASCRNSCDDTCDVDLPRGDCDAVCEASCEGSCRVDGNLDCQLACEDDSYARCETEVRGGCETRCSGEEGALFCNGQFVDNRREVGECIDSLIETLDAHIDVYADSSTSCRGSRCRTRSEAGIVTHCSTALVGAESSIVPGLAILALCSVLGLRRRRAPRRPD